MRWFPGSAPYSYLWWKPFLFKQIQNFCCFISPRISEKDVEGHWRLKHLGWKLLCNTTLGLSSWPLLQMELANPDPPACLKQHSTETCKSLSYSTNVVQFLLSFSTAYYFSYKMEKEVLLTWCPHIRFWEAIMMAFIPEAQTLFIVVHGVETGKPKTNNK